MTTQEQAFLNWYDNQPTFGVDYQEIWNAACKWQQEQYNIDGPIAWAWKYNLQDITSIKPDDSDLVNYIPLYYIALEN